MSVASAVWSVRNAGAQEFLQQALEAGTWGVARGIDPRSPGLLNEVCESAMRRAGLYGLAPPSRVDVLIAPSEEQGTLSADLQNALLHQVREACAVPRHQPPQVRLRSESFKALCEGYHMIRRRDAQRVLVAAMFEVKRSDEALSAQRRPADAAAAVLLESEVEVAARPVGRHRFNVLDQDTCWSQPQGEERARVLGLLQRHAHKPVYTGTVSVLLPAIGLLSESAHGWAPNLAGHVTPASGGCLALLQLVDAFERHAAGDPSLAKGALLTHDGTSVDDPTGVLVVGPAHSSGRAPLDA